MIQLQNISAPEYRYGMRKKTVSEKTTILKKTVYFVSLCFAIFLSIFMYFYLKEYGNFNPSYIPIYKFSNKETLKHYIKYTTDIIRKNYKKNWLYSDVNAVLSNYVNDINKDYKEYFFYFLSELGNMEKNYYGMFINNSINIYKFLIFSYYFSQELKIKKISGEELSEKEKKLLDNILKYIYLCQNIDGGFGTQPKDQKSIPQAMFWVALFIRNYTILTSKIPYKMLKNIKNYVDKEHNIISLFVNFFLFNEKPNEIAREKNCRYIEQLLSYRFLMNVKEDKNKNFLLMFL